MVQEMINPVWSRLRQVRTLQFTAHSQSDTGWSGTGSGGVTVLEPAEGVIVFEEAGRWRSLAQVERRFRNVFRWSVVGAHLRLEHLRFGTTRPVFLFDLCPQSSGEWREISPHQCGKDRYTACLRLVGDQVQVSWQIQGPRKQESIDYVYWW